MPGYVSHTIMARDVYSKLNKKNVSLDYMLTYSLGGDLSKYAKCRKACHRVNKDMFIYNMCDYIRDNKLCNDGEILGTLYGHICHMLMDDIMHPLIRKVSKICIWNKKNHTLIEGYYDNYLVKKKYQCMVSEYDNKVLFRGKMNKKISNMIDYVYKKTYDTSNVSLYYKFNIFLYKKIRYLYKILGINVLKIVSGFNRFMSSNKNINILNLDNKIEYIDYVGYKCNDDMDSLYEVSVNLALIYINNVNKYMGIDT